MESKHEEKEGKESDEMEPLAMVEVQRIDIETGPMPLSSSLDMEIDFALDRPLGRAFWVVKVRICISCLSLTFECNCSIW
jgi:hypothetical protein